MLEVEHNAFILQNIKDYYKLFECLDIWIPENCAIDEKQYKDYLETRIIAYEDQMESERNEQMQQQVCNDQQSCSSVYLKGKNHMNTVSFITLLYIVLEAKIFLFFCVAPNNLDIFKAIASNLRLIFLLLSISVIQNHRQITSNLIYLTYLMIVIKNLKRVWEI